MPVGDEKETLGFFLEPDPVFQDAVIVAQMEAARGPHAGENPPSFRLNRHGKLQTAERSCKGGPGGHCQWKDTGVILPDPPRHLNVYPELSAELQSNLPALHPGPGIAPADRTPAYHQARLNPRRSRIAVRVRSGEDAYSLVQ